MTNKNPRLVWLLWCFKEFGHFFVIVGLIIIFLSVGDTKVSCYVGEEKDNCDGKMYEELQDLKEENELLREKLLVHKHRWKDVEEYIQKSCEGPPPSKFYMNVDFAFGGCKLAKKGERWDFVFRDWFHDHRTYWRCKERQGGRPHDYIPRSQRRKLIREEDSCALRWNTILETGDTKGARNIAMVGANATVTWKLNR